MDLFNYTPRCTHVAHIKGCDIGGDNPLRLQSMTTCATTDTEGCVAQCERIIRAGGDLVRLTAQGTIEANNLAPIRQALRDAELAQRFAAYKAGLKDKIVKANEALAEEKKKYQYCAK